MPTPWEVKHRRELRNRKLEIVFLFVTGLAFGAAATGLAFFVL